jgi:hypothetical protein
MTEGGFQLLGSFERREDEHVPRAVGLGVGGEAVEDGGLGAGHDLSRPDWTWPGRAVHTLWGGGVGSRVAPTDSRTFRAVAAALRARLRSVSSHALREAEEDRLTLDDIEIATLAGECIEDYPADPRGPSCLVLGGTADGSVIHALWGFDAPSGQAILITVYLPDPQRWTPDFRARRTRDDSEAE